MLSSVREVSETPVPAHVVEKGIRKPGLLAHVMWLSLPTQCAIKITESLPHRRMTV